MSIFDEMLKPNNIDDFLLKKSRRLFLSSDKSNFDKLKNYLKSDKYIKDVLKLKNKEYFISIPKKIEIKKINSAKRRICYIYKEEELFLYILLSTSTKYLFKIITG